MDQTRKTGFGWWGADNINQNVWAEAIRGSEASDHSRLVVTPCEIKGSFKGVHCPHGSGRCLPNPSQIFIGVEPQQTQCEVVTAGELPFSTTMQCGTMWPCGMENLNRRHQH